MVFYAKPFCELYFLSTTFLKIFALTNYNYEVVAKKIYKYFWHRLLRRTLVQLRFHKQNETSFALLIGYCGDVPAKEVFSLTLQRKQISIMARKIISFIGIVIIPVLLILFFWRKHELNAGSRYTITTTIRQFRTLKSGLIIEHFYFVNNKKYVETYNKNEYLNIIYPNGRYLVKFAKSYPSISEVLWEKPVPDSIKEPPPEGWEHLPF